MRFTATVRISNGRDASTSSIVEGMVCTMSAGDLMICPSSLNWAPAKDTTISPNKNILMGMPQKLPRTIAPRLLAERVKSQKFSTNVP